MSANAEGPRLIQAFRDAGRVVRDPERIFCATVALAKSTEPEAKAFIPSESEAEILFDALLFCEDVSAAESILRFAQRAKPASRSVAHFATGIISLRGDWRVGGRFESGTFFEQKLARNETFLLLAADSLVAMEGSAVYYLKALLTHRDPETRALAADIARRIGRAAEPLADLLLDLLTAEDADHRLIGSWALATSSSAAAELVVETVTPFLEASDWVKRGRAVTVLALVAHAGTPAIPLLKAMTEDRYEQDVVKERALAALQAIEQSSSNSFRTLPRSR